MEALAVILDFLKYFLPAVFVIAAVKLVIDSNDKRRQRREWMEIRGEALKKVIPLRLQAYERGILFLERISPENLLVRVNGHGQSAKGYQLQLQMEVRAEYEHNFAMQLYISPGPWKELVRAKEQVLAVVNESAKALPATATGFDLSKLILETLMKTESMPTRQGIHALKMDLQKTFKLAV